jgi:alpha-tubulin suppressor-like RCC1 family protein
LGDGTSNLYPEPTRIGTSTDWKNVAAGIGFSTGLKTDGTLWAWGDNSFGQLGTGTNGPGTNVPIQIGSDHDWEAVDNSKFDYFYGCTLALKTDGSLWSWGDNPPLSQGNVPTRVGTDADWRTFSVGNWHIIALKTDGSLWTWGSSTGGGLPDRIGIDTNWVAVAAGVEISTALKTDGTLWSWNVGGSPQQIGTDTDWGSPP